MDFFLLYKVRIVFFGNTLVHNNQINIVPWQEIDGDHCILFLSNMFQSTLAIDH